MNYFTLPIRLYQLFISPFLGVHCRFEPSCSEYAKIALHQHGVVKGGLLTVKRVCKCNPLGSSGFDPVPTTHSTPRQQ